MRKIILLCLSFSISSSINANERYYDMQTIGTIFECAILQMRLGNFNEYQRLDRLAINALIPHIPPKKSLQEELGLTSPIFHGSFVSGTKRNAEDAVSNDIMNKITYNTFSIPVTAEKLRPLLAERNCSYFN